MSTHLNNTPGNNGTLRWAVPLVLALLAISMALSSAGCAKDALTQTNLTPRSTTPERIEHVQGYVADARGWVHKIVDAARRLSPETVAEIRPQIEAWGNAADQTLADASQRADEAKASSEQDRQNADTAAKQQQKLQEALREAQEQADAPIRKTFQWLAVLCYVAAVGLTIWGALSMRAGGRAMSQFGLAGLCVFAGSAFVFLAIYMRTLAWIAGIVLGLCFIAFALYAVLALRRYLQTNNALGNVVKTIDQAVENGAIDWRPAATDLMDKALTKSQKALIDSHQDRRTPRKAVRP